jgi:hypothetical protein
MLTHATQARDIMNAYYPQDPSSGSFKTSQKEDRAGLSLATWATRKSIHTQPSDRDARYLCAYVEICRQSGRPFYAGGIPLDESIWLDRAVIATLLAHGCLSFDPKFQVFVPTEKGDALMSTIPRPPQLQL